MRIPKYRFVVLLLLLGGCGDDDPRVARSAVDEMPDSLRYGGTAVIGAGDDLQTMNALATSDYPSMLVQRDLLFTPLLRYDENLDPVPWLAAAWDTARVAPDTLELTFRLRRDVEWHDGKPVTAEDVLFTFNRAIDPETAFPNVSRFQFYSPRAELVDPFTIRFRLKPHSDFLDPWFQTPPMPEHILGNVPPEQLATHPFGTAEPVGSGPFRFVRRTPGQEWVFEANPDFPRALGGRPYLDRVVYRSIPDQTALLTELMTGGIDVHLAPTPDMAERIKAAPGTELVALPFRQWVWIAWNTRLPLFDTAEERRALTMAIDRESIVEGPIRGYGDVGRATITPGHWSYNVGGARTLVPYDTAGARQLLAQAGWADRDNDGVLEDIRGREFRFTLKTNQGNETRKDITQIVQAQLRPLGVMVQPEVVEMNTLVEQLTSNVDDRGERSRDFEAALFSWVDDFRKDDTDILHSRRLEGPFQLVGYANPAADRLIDSLAVITDREAARPLWREYQRLMARESPYTVLYYPQRLVGLRERLRGIEMDARGDFATVARWWIPPPERRPGTVTSGSARAR